MQSGFRNGLTWKSYVQGEILGFEELEKAAVAFFRIHPKKWSLTIYK